MATLFDHPYLSLLLVSTHSEFAITIGTDQDIIFLWRPCEANSCLRRGLIGWWRRLWAYVTHSETLRFEVKLVGKVEIQTHVLEIQHIGIIRHSMPGLVIGMSLVMTVMSRRSGRRA